MRELRYAGLLHDFGKVGVREKVLVKAKKLHPAALLQVEQRHQFLLRSAELRYERERADWLERNGQEGYDAYLATLKDRLMRERARLERFIRSVHRANEPTVLPGPDEPGLEEFERATYIGPDGQPLPFLTADELRSLAVRQGSLDDDEGVEMRRHVTHTFDFLRNIPWTSDLMGVPNIAHGHHEKLDGSGYPRGLAGAEIPIQTRMMTIADIFDALTAADRPYKKAVPVARALDVLSEDVRQGRLDGDLFSLFVEARIHETGGRVTL
jgi:response regulator RpfG family c-di-GMP phosphodiesterase